jgi:hypothetical protein
VHAHLIVGRKDGTAHGGHLLEAHVRRWTPYASKRKAARKAITRALVNA